MKEKKSIKARLEDLSHWETKSIKQLDEKFGLLGLDGRHIPLPLPESVLDEVVREADKRYKDKRMHQLFVLGDFHSRFAAIEAIALLGSLLDRRSKEAYRAGTRFCLRSGIEMRQYAALIDSALDRVG